MPFRRLAVAVAVGLCFLIAPVLAVADSVDFSALAGSPGSATFSGVLGTSLNATAKSVSAESIPGGTTLALTGASLSLMTAGATSTAGLDFFGPGGTITVGNSILCDGNCFTGKFTGGQLLITGGGSTAVFIGTFVFGNISQTLLTALGFSDTSHTLGTGSISASFFGTSGPDGSFSGSWVSGDLVITQLAEPATLILFAAGLILLPFLVRRVARQ